MQIPAHIQQPATISNDDWLWFWQELDRILAQLRRERNWRYGVPALAAAQTTPAHPSLAQHNSAPVDFGRGTGAAHGRKHTRVILSGLAPVTIREVRRVCTGTPVS
ncbi:MAG: hypothetical protein M3R24_40440 [Chloroflexota bacterium]|nr:hypothetical protein [Chloroflexota bacterium]